MRSSLAEQRPGRRAWAGILVALVLAAYLPVLSFGFVNWDDDELVLRNSAVTRVDGLRRIWSSLELPEGFPNYPLTMSSYWLECRLWGLNPLGYHAVNVLLHAANVLLVYQLALSLGFSFAAAWWIAALFGLHPMQVESVAWVAERKNVLSGLFFLAAFNAYLSWGRSRAGRWYAASLALFVAALLSKTATLVLPLSLLLADRLREDGWRNGAKRLLPFFALSALAALQTIAAEHQSIYLPWSHRPVLFGATLSFYAGKLLWPFPLIPIYPRWTIAPASPLWWLPFLGVVAVAGTLWLRSADKRLQWGLGHFACMLLPVSGLVPYGYHEFSFVADRNVYLASIGFFAALAALWTHLPRLVASRALAAVGFGVLALAAAATALQLPQWADSRHLWTYVIDANPDAWVARDNLSLILIDEGEIDAAKDLLRRSLELNPDGPAAHANLALALYRQGDAAGAERECRAAIRANPKSPEYYQNLSFALRMQGRVAEAEETLRAALRLAPGDGGLHYLLAQVVAEQRGSAEALPEYRRAADLAPDMIAAQNDLGRALLAVGRAGEAAKVFARLVERQPAAVETRYNFALALAAIGRRDEALEQAEEALRLEPDSAAARDLVARLRAPAPPATPGSSSEPLSRGAGSITDA